MKVKQCIWCATHLSDNVIIHPYILSWQYCSEYCQDKHTRNPSEINNEDLFFYPGENVTCWKCKWNGELRDCKQEYHHSNPQSWRSLSGREGYVYYCPECRWQIKANWLRMS